MQLRFRSGITSLALVLDLGLTLNRALAPAPSPLRAIQNLAFGLPGAVCCDESYAPD